jgi:hypothetical protein
MNTAPILKNLPVSQAFELDFRRLAAFSLPSPSMVCFSNGTPTLA